MTATIHTRMGYVKVDGARLRHLRERRLMSLRDLSKAAGVAIYTISAAETGKRPEGVQPRTVHKLAKALFVMPEELLLRVEEDDH